MTGSIQLRDLDPLHGGQAELSLPWTGDAPHRCPVVIRRGTTKDPFLGKSGWQAVEHAFDPQDIQLDSGQLRLIFGPELVDNVLRDDDLVQVSLPLSGQADVLAWRGITRSVILTHIPAPPDAQKAAPRPSGLKPPVLIPLSSADQPDRITLLVKSATDLPTDLALRITRDADLAHLGPGGWQASPHALSPHSREDGPDGARLVFALPANLHGGPAVLTLGDATLDIQLVDGSGHVPIDTGSAPDQGGTRRGPLLALLCVLLLAAMAGGGWWWWSQRDDPVIETSPELAEEPTADQPVETPPDPGGDEDTSAQSPPDTPSAEIPPAQAAYDTAIAAMAADDCALARREMLVSVQGNYGPALLAWAESQDSLDFKPCLTETQNDVSALDHLKRACEANAEGAKDALQRLSAELQRRAEQGDDAAQDVLRLAVPDAQQACGS